MCGGLRMEGRGTQPGLGWFQNSRPISGVAVGSFVISELCSFGFGILDCCSNNSKA